MRYNARWMNMAGKGPLGTVSGMTGLFVMLAEIFLVFRVILKFFFTSAGGGFVHWAFSTTDVLLVPFRSIWPNPSMTPGNWYVDWVALFAMAVYAAVGVVLIGLARWATGWNAVTRR
jgi:hypothetical protein